MITFGNKLNRRYSLNFPFLDSYGIIDIYFHKNNSYLALNICPKFIDYLKNNDCWYYIYRDIKKSPFVNTFLKVSDLQTKRMDIQNQFSNIQEDQKGKIQYLNNETVKVSRLETNNGTFESLLYVYTFTFDNEGNEFLYTIIERQHIDMALEKKVVRSIGVQLSTNTKLQDMLKRCNYNHNESEKINNLSELRID